MTKEERELLILIADMVYRMFIMQTLDSCYTPGVKNEDASRKYGNEIRNIKERLLPLLEHLEAKRKTELQPELPQSSQ
jgi:hypothetical protein